MAEFLYNNVKNANINYICIELLIVIIFYFLFKDRINSYLKSHSVTKQTIKYKQLILIYQSNRFYFQKYAKQTPDEKAKPCSYILNEII